MGFGLPDQESIRVGSREGNCRGRSSLEGSVDGAESFKSEQPEWRGMETFCE